MNPQYINDRRAEALGFINDPKATLSQKRLAFKFLKEWGCKNGT